MKKMNFKSESGFTLMELMVVVGVLAILIAILLPQFSGYTAQAQAVSAASEVKNALTAGYSYYVSSTSRDAGGFDEDIAVERMARAVKDVTSGVVGTKVNKGGGTGKDFTYTVTKGDLTFKATLDITTGEVVATSSGTGSGSPSTYGGAKGEMQCSGNASTCSDLHDEGALTVE